MRTSVPRPSQAHGVNRLWPRSKRSAMPTHSVNGSGMVVPRSRTEVCNRRPYAP